MVAIRYSFAAFAAAAPLATPRRGFPPCTQWHPSGRCVPAPGHHAPKDRRSCALYSTQWQQNRCRRAGGRWPVQGPVVPLGAGLCGRDGISPDGLAGHGLAGSRTGLVMDWRSWLPVMAAGHGCRSRPGGTGAMARRLMCANHASGNKRRRGVRACLSPDAQRRCPSYIPPAFVGLGTRTSAGDR
jgi:hypothetical protein